MGCKEDIHAEDPLMVTLCNGHRCLQYSWLRRLESLSLNVAGLWAGQRRAMRRNTMTQWGIASKHRSDSPARDDWVTPLAWGIPKLWVAVKELKLGRHTKYYGLLWLAYCGDLTQTL